MIPIKIQCGCGQKYSFDADPAWGQMTQAVKCPVCGADATAVANQVIAEHLAAQPPPPPAAPAALRRAALATRPGPAPAATPGHTPFRTAAPPEEPKSYKRAIRLTATVVGGVLLLAAVVAGGWYWLAHRQQPQAVLTIPEDGFPRTLNDAAAMYEFVRDYRNGALALLHGVEAIQLTDADRNSSDLPIVGKAKFPSPGGPLPSPMKSALADVVKRNHAAYELFVVTANSEKSRYSVDASQGLKLQLPHLPKVRQAAAFLELWTLGQADARQGKAAGEGVVLGMGAARTLNDEPVAVSQLTRVAGIAATVAALEQVVNRVALPPGSLTNLQAVFENDESRESAGTSFTRALVTERAIALDLCNAAAENLPDQFRPVAKALKSDWPFLLETYNLLLTARKEPFPSRLKADEIIKQRVVEAADKKLVTVALLAPALAGLTAKEAGSVARLRLGLTALALERFRAAHANHYPDKLDEIAPDILTTVPKDPYDGQPLRYTKGADGYELQCGGTSDPKTAALFTVVKPPKSIASAK